MGTKPTCSDRALLVDFGSTFTKVRVVDLNNGRLVGTAQAPSSVGSDINIGLQHALSKLPQPVQAALSEHDTRLACSSAAGGLRIVAIGLARDLTAEAAYRAALGAGGKVIETYAGGLTAGDVLAIEDEAPDLIILAGGTDGGDRRCIEDNAGLIARSGIDCPLIVAGNRNAHDTVMRTLLKADKPAVAVANLLPDVSRLTVDECQAAVREAFLSRITAAKGLDLLQAAWGKVVMPTPQAVRTGIELLARGVDGQPGRGEVMCVDIGGATTDVYSVGAGAPSGPEVVQRGLPEPFVKRTVEGDLGVRISARSVLTLVGASTLAETMGGLDLDVERAVEALQDKTERLPDSRDLQRLDVALGYWASRLAARRHAGTYEIVYGPLGRTIVQTGKDLTAVQTVIGTGGILAQGGRGNALEILAGVSHDSGETHLTPAAASMFIDSEYVLFAAGLLAEVRPEAAMRLARQSLVRASNPVEVPTTGAVG